MTKGRMKGKIHLWKGCNEEEHEILWNAILIDELWRNSQMIRRIWLLTEYIFFWVKGNYNLQNIWHTSYVMFTFWKYLPLAIQFLGSSFGRLRDSWKSYSKVWWQSVKSPMNFLCTGHYLVAVCLFAFILCIVIICSISYLLIWIWAKSLIWEAMSCFELT